MSDELGRPRYRVSGRPSQRDPRVALAEILARFGRGLTAAQNIVVIRSELGTAPAIARALDRARHPLVVGTLAGDDTCLVIAASAKPTRGCLCASSPRRFELEVGGVGANDLRRRRLLVLAEPREAVCVEIELDPALGDRPDPLRRHVDLGAQQPVRDGEAVEDVACRSRPRRPPSCRGRRRRGRPPSTRARSAATRRDRRRSNRLPLDVPDGALAYRRCGCPRARAGSRRGR